MNLRTFIERPVLSAVISITIVVVGIIGLFSLPVEQYPDIAPPTIMVSTTYYGASAETLQKSVIAPLEEAINGVEDMTYMTSSATNSGSVSITVYFKQGTDPDMAAVNVQNRVSRATGQLPAEVTQVGVTTSKRQTSILQMFSLYSPDDSYDENFLSNYISINLKPQILRISGVGDLMIMGGEYSMRVWMKPDVMAQYKLIPSDITGVLAEQNIESATGSFGENSDETYQYTMKYTGRLITPEEFGDIVIRSTDNGEVLKLKDVADIQLGQDSYAYHGGMDGHPGVSCMVFQTAGSNATEVNQNIDKLLEEASKDLPKGVELTQMMSSNDFLFASIHEVVKTLIEAIILVILVVYVFLQDFRVFFHACAQGPRRFLPPGGKHGKKCAGGKTGGQQQESGRQDGGGMHAGHHGFTGFQYNAVHGQSGLPGGSSCGPAGRSRYRFPPPGAVAGLCGPGGNYAFSG